MADDNKVSVTITLKGPVVEIVDALANGLPVEGLVALREAFSAELAARAEKEKADAGSR